MELTVNVINNEALQLLHNMETLNLIKVRMPVVVKKARKTQRLSDRFAGALQLTDEQYADFQSSIQKGRAEWERNIY